MLDPRPISPDDFEPFDLEEPLQPPRAEAELEDADTETSEPQDGVVTDTAEDLDAAEVAAADSDGGDASAAPDVDLGALESLLLTTHHPLTAGRIGELLDLPTTKPIRRAIKQLNELYASTGRSFRIEQVAGGFQILTLP